jgi:DNA polymerase-3 subunit epsilon
MTNVSMPERVLVLDTETTGLSAAARIVEIAAIEVEPRTGRVHSQLHHLVNPLMPIPAAVTRIHGIRDRDVQDKPSFAAIAGEVADFLRGATLAIQNASFDRRILDAELARAGQPSLGGLDVRVVDTLDVSRGVFPLLRGHSLDRICDHVAVDRAGRTHHGALVDARLLAETLPKFAVEYDAWCAVGEEDCARELDTVDHDLHALLGELSALRDMTSAEGVDLRLSHVASALAWIGHCEIELRARAAAMVGPNGWCCKHFVGRWVSSESISWKDAAGEYLSPKDLQGFRSEAATRVLTPHPDVEVAARLGALGLAFDRPTVASSVACAVRALLLLRSLRKGLEAERGDLRQRVLQYVDDGYVLRYASLTDGMRTSIDYRGAMAVLARGADVEPFATRRSRLHVSVRDAASCEALFG